MSPYKNLRIKNRGIVMGKIWKEIANVGCVRVAKKNKKPPTKKDEKCFAEHFLGSPFPVRTANTIKKNPHEKSGFQKISTVLLNLPRFGEP